MEHINMLRIILISILITTSELDFSKADFQFCYHGTHRITTDPSRNHSDLYCPGGILFHKPVEIQAAHSLNDFGFCAKTEICKSKSWKCGERKQHVKAQVIVDTPYDRESWSLFSTDDKVIHTKIPECQSHSPQVDLSNSKNLENELDPHHYHPSKSKRSRREIGAENENFGFPTSDSGLKVPKELIEQTKRMFFFLVDLNPESIHSNLRAVALLEKSIEIVQSVCDPNFLNQDFMREVKRAFLFILKEQGTERISDVDLDDFELLTSALDACAQAPNPLTLKGETCAMRVEVHEVQRTVNGKDTAVPYRISPISFQWGKYDFIVDAMWYAVNIIHGLCFATFRPNINLHHKYQATMEELFKFDILKRWEHPLSLYRNYVYNHIFLSPVNNSMQVLDACTVGSYIGSPFLHRLNRPTESQPIRLKRDIQDLGNPLNNQNHNERFKAIFGDSATCLQNEAERIASIDELKRIQCP